MPYQLTDEELERWTGATDPKIQRRVLKAQGIPFRLRDDKKAVTTWEAINSALIDGAPVLSKFDPTSEPDFSQFDKPAAKGKSQA